jgi:hypothetical protein
MITGSQPTTGFIMEEISAHTHKCPDKAGGKFGNILHWPADANVNDRWYKVRWLFEYANSTMGSVFVFGCYVVLDDGDHLLVVWKKITHALGRLRSVK